MDLEKEIQKNRLNQRQQKAEITGWQKKEMEEENKKKEKRSLEKIQKELEEVENILYPKEGDTVTLPLGKGEEYFNELEKRHEKLINELKEEMGEDYI